MFAELLADIAGVNWWVTGPVCAFCFCSVLLLMYWAYGGKPDESYDAEPPLEQGHEVRLHAYRREEFRRMLERAQTDDERCDAIDWARVGFRLSSREIEEILDQVRPLTDLHCQAAFAVRREQLNIAG